MTPLLLTYSRVPVVSGGQIWAVIKAFPSDDLAGKSRPQDLLQN